jgi:hypothetical protein
MPVDVVAGTPHGRFQRAIQRHHLFHAEVAAREVGRLNPADALALAALIAKEDPQRCGRAAVRWHGRFELEARRLEVPQSRLALAALASLPGDGETARGSPGKRASAASADRGPGRFHASARWQKTKVRLVLAVIAAALALVTPAAAVAHPGRWHWSLGQVMKRLTGTRLHVGARVVRIDADTLLCSGDGRPGRVRGTRVWKHFVCTYSVFAAHGIYDCEFRVHVLGLRKFVITDAHWPSGAP